MYPRAPNGLIQVTMGKGKKGRKKVPGGYQAADTGRQGQALATVSMIPFHTVFLLVPAAWIDAQI